MSSARFIFIFYCLSSFAPAAEPPQSIDRPVAENPALKPAETAAQFKLPPGFKATAFAGEPDVVQPIAMTMDARGRIWVVTNTNYPHCPGEPKDSILIFEDADGDGLSEKRTVFFDQLTFSSGIAVGHGGVWIGSPPNLLFFPDKNGDDRPDGEPQIILDGWGKEDTHETLNNFIWGPDGWLYGTQGVFTHSKVGKPGTPDPERVPINAGIWRLHPKTHQFEIWAEGGSNQWGVDWNDHGEAFFEACVIPHMWHAIQGARYERQAGSHFNKHIYENIKTIAWGRYEKAAYAGMMIYLGGLFPEKYRDTLFFHDIHFNSQLNERVLRTGSGYKSQRLDPLLTSEDKWFRGLSPQYGPDGSVFINDWYDRVPCHQQSAFTDRLNGRIYKITTDQVKPVQVDIARLPEAALIRHQLHRNDWWVRAARLEIATRGLSEEGRIELEKILTQNPDDTRQLRALWALHSGGKLHENTTLRAMQAASESVRGWAITLACENSDPSPSLLARITQLAESDPSPLVRLRIASAAQRIPIASRWPILQHLAQHADDTADQNIPFMIWIAAEPAIAQDAQKAGQFLITCKIQKLANFTARRMAHNPSHLEPLIASLSKIPLPATQASALTGILAALQGQRDIPQPANWPSTYATLITSTDRTVRAQTQSLSATFGGEATLKEMRAKLADHTAPLEQRKQALESLAARRDPGAFDSLLKLISQSNPLREASIHALSGYEDPRVPPGIIAIFQTLNTTEKRTAIQTLLTRISGAKAFITAVDTGSIPKTELTAPITRQIEGFKDPALSAWIAKNWGAISPSSDDKRKLIEKYKKFTSPDAVQRADAHHGRALFVQTCAVCHSMFGSGGHIGPELTGGYADMEYLLTNILDPNAVIGKDYQQTFVKTKDGQIIAGVITQQAETSIALKTLTGEILTVQKPNIASMETSPLSMMPEGLLAGMDESSVRDLIRYLGQKSQLPMLVTPMNANDFFSGSDLRNWRASSPSIRIDRGAIQMDGQTQTQSLTSEMVAADYKLTAHIALKRKNAVAEFSLAGTMKDGKFQGLTLSIGENSRANIWNYQSDATPSSLIGKRTLETDTTHTMEFIRKDGKLIVKLDGSVEFETPDPQPKQPTAPAIWLRGEGASLRIESLKIQPLK